MTFARGKQKSDLQAFSSCRVFMFLLLLFLVHQWSVALFRMMGALCRNIVVANAVGLMFMLLVFLMGGFVITKQNIRPWVVWMYWCSPMQVCSSC